MSAMEIKESPLKTPAKLLEGVAIPVITCPDCHQRLSCCEHVCPVRPDLWQWQYAAPPEFKPVSGGTMSEQQVLPEWECFRDLAYYNMWCVRKVGERRFGFGYHVSSEAEARALCEEMSTALASLAQSEAERERLQDRITFDRLDNSHPATHCLRLLGDFGISVGKACEYLSKYFLTGELDPIAEEFTEYDAMLDEVSPSEIARQLRSARAELARERERNQWRDCKQKLPPDDKYVLVWQNFFAPRVSLARYWGEDLGWHMSAVTGNVNAYVTHWMPMLDSPALLEPQPAPVVTGEK